MRVVLDTNVLISAFAARGICADLFRDVLTSHELCLSSYILDELEEKLLQKLKIPPSTVQSIQSLLKPYEIASNDSLEDINIRDADDRPIVNFAISINADLLITGDKMLREDCQPLPIRCITPREFYQ